MRQLRELQHTMYHAIQKDVLCIRPALEMLICFHLLKLNCNYCENWFCLHWAIYQIPAIRPKESTRAPNFFGQPIPGGRTLMVKTSFTFCNRFTGSTKYFDCLFVQKYFKYVYSLLKHTCNEWHFSPSFSQNVVQSFQSKIYGMCRESELYFKHNDDVIQQIKCQIVLEQEVWNLKVYSK